jgi:hypothetical protein
MMERHLPERDWKTLRALLPVTLDLFCERVLAEVSGITSNTSRSNHERYQAIYKLIEERGRQIQDAFGDMRRSRAVMRLGHMCELGLVTEEEFARFSDDMRGVVEHFWGRFPRYEAEAATS